MIRMTRMNQLSHAVAALAAATLAGHADGGGCQPPPNETCSGQIVFTTAQLPFEDDGLIGCVNNVIDKPYWDIFYRYDCAITADHTFEMCDSAQDAYIRIYVNGCGWADGQEFAVGDDECPGSPPNADPVITVPLVAGTPYWIELGTWRPDQPWGAPNIPFRFLVTVEGCEGALRLDGGLDEPLPRLLFGWITLTIFWSASVFNLLCVDLLITNNTTKHIMISTTNNI